MYFKILGCFTFWGVLVGWLLFGLGGGAVDTRKLNFIGNLKIAGHVFIIRIYLM